MLYNDAKRRQEELEKRVKNAEKKKEHDIMSSKPPVGINNIRYAIQKFEKDFYYACQIIFQD